MPQWTTPTYTPAGWRKPCYLIADEHVQTFYLLMETDWKAYGFGRDPRCANCMMHCGYEGSAIPRRCPARRRSASSPGALYGRAVPSTPDRGGGRVILVFAAMQTEVRACLGWVRQ